jgi:hypothetical protein
MFNSAMFLAASGFVAFVLVFVHPGSQASRAGARQAAAGAEVSIGEVATTESRSRLAVSKWLHRATIEIRRREKHQQHMQP